MPLLIPMEERDALTARAITNIILKRGLEEQARSQPPPDMCDWIEANFYSVSAAQETIDEDRDTITVQPPSSLIRLTRWQKAILHYIFRHRFTTIIYSTPKKSGKTTLAAAVARYVAEHYGPHAEILCLAKDKEQAHSRVYDACMRSVSLSPTYSKRRRETEVWVAWEKDMTHKPTGGTIKAVSSDYKGEAGANPTLTVWTELWNYQSESFYRLWAELTPVPTRAFSMRWVETYAGRTGESELLEQLYELGKAGRQLSAGELGDLGCFPESPRNADPIPIWVNESAGLFMYWDFGIIARRMPWQQGVVAHRYYIQQEQMLSPNEYRRLHLNEWTGSEAQFIPIEWWDACIDPIPLKAEDRTPLVVAIDASVTGDCTAISVCARHPVHHDHIAERYSRAWYPHQMPGGKMNYQTSISDVVDWLTKNYNVVQVAYDPYQLHHWAVEQRAQTPSAWYREFGQGEERLVADKGLYDAIRDRRLHHLGEMEMRQHIINADAEIPAKQENKLRLVKKTKGKKIDLACALSMAHRECQRLML